MGIAVDDEAARPHQRADHGRPAARRAPADVDPGRRRGDGRRAGAGQESGLRFWMSDADKAIAAGRRGAPRDASSGSARRASRPAATPARATRCTAIQDALKTFDADRIVLFTHAGDDRATARTSTPTRSPSASARPVDRATVVVAAPSLTVSVPSRRQQRAAALAGANPLPVVVEVGEHGFAPAPLGDPPRPRLDLGRRVVAAAPARPVVEAHEPPGRGRLERLKRPLGMVADRQRHAARAQTRPSPRARTSSRGGTRSCASRQAAARASRPAARRRGGSSRAAATAPDRGGRRRSAAASGS